MRKARGHGVMVVSAPERGEDSAARTCCAACRSCAQGTGEPPLLTSSKAMARLTLPASASIASRLSGSGSRPRAPRAFSTRACAALRVPSTNCAFGKAATWATPARWFTTRSAATHCASSAVWERKPCRALAESTSTERELTCASDASAAAERAPPASCTPAEAAAEALSSAWMTVSASSRPLTSEMMASAPSMLSSGVAPGSTTARSAALASAPKASAATTSRSSAKALASTPAGRRAWSDVAEGDEGFRMLAGWPCCGSATKVKRSGRSGSDQPDVCRSKIVEKEPSSGKTLSAPPAGGAFAVKRTLICASSAPERRVPSGATKGGTKAARSVSVYCAPGRRESGGRTRSAGAAGPCEKYEAFAAPAATASPCGAPVSRSVHCQTTSGA